MKHVPISDLKAKKRQDRRKARRRNRERGCSYLDANPEKREKFWAKYPESRIAWDARRQKAIDESRQAERRKQVRTWDEEFAAAMLNPSEADPE